MTPLLINATEFTPEVILDHLNNVYRISGESRPEHAGKFYSPILQWLEQYKQILYWQKEKSNFKSFDFEVKLEYFNSTSAKYIMDIFQKLNEYSKEGLPVKIKWFYDPLDADIKMSGEEYEKLLEIPFEYLPN